MEWLEVVQYCFWGILLVKERNKATQIWEVGKETLLIDKRGCRESRDILQSTTAFIIFAFNTDAKSPKKIIIFLWLIYIYSQAICFKALTIG